GNDARHGRRDEEHAGRVRARAQELRREARQAVSEPVALVGRGFCYEDLRVGFRFRTHRRTVAEADLAAFVNLSWLTEELFAVADDAARAIKGRAVPAALDCPGGV